MMRDALVGHYRGYIACLNRRDWAGLGRYVGEDVCYNGTRIGLDGYRAMLIADVRAIPELSASRKTCSTTSAASGTSVR